ncbi:hypothetical protein B7G68_11960 [Caulobacter segnis]|jgi:hypothetical protein|uniref:Uncharacterized protein n=2 Tax=Caulobacter segnis TaxID=88688 RepID=D5VH73_CAUST|nr:hypothetical protein [Caulobacter segnis]ADG10791.1 conserved hypothetical protein [Caulobacter segnis ATCC 21756]AVQ02496.1 hypothetical protein B7G68_11960 [Caulobacter segnis]
MFEDLFRQFWWLLFPLAGFAYGAWQSWLSYRANQETLDLIKTYAASGREPPAELMNKLSRRWHDDDEDDRPRYRRRRERTWYQVVLFGLLSCGFAFAAITDIYGAGEAFTIAAFVLGAVCAATLVQVMLDRNGPTV